MKPIYHDMAIKQVHQHLASLYLICGDNCIWRDETLTAIRQQAKTEGFAPPKRIEAARMDWDVFLAQYQSPGLFERQLMTEIHFSSSQPTLAASQALSAFKPHPEHLLVLLLDKPSKKMQQSPWFKALCQSGQWIQLRPVTPTSMQTWLKGRLHDLGFEYNQATLNAILKRTHGNLVAAHQLLQSLPLTLDSQRITPEMISSLTLPQGHFTVYEVMEAACWGNTHQVHHRLFRLQQDGTELSLLLWAFSRTLRELLQLQQSMDLELCTLPEAFRKHQVWQSKQPYYQAALGRHHHRSLRELLKKCAELDLAVKGFTQDDAWQAALLLGLKLASTPSAYANDATELDEVDSLNILEHV